MHISSTEVTKWLLFKTSEMPKLSWKQNISYIKMYFIFPGQFTHPLVNVQVNDSVICFSFLKVQIVRIIFLFQKKAKWKKESWNFVLCQIPTREEECYFVWRAKGKKYSCNFMKWNFWLKVCLWKTRQERVLQ